MRPGQRDERVEHKDRSAEVPADAAPESTRERMQNDAADRPAGDNEPARGADDFDPTSRGDDSGEVM
jgi:hypothetical protein